MVYCGKPSKGCGQCRTRKVRCDQAQPACSQCVRAKRECPGYRDQLSLMFRDESKSVARKAKAEAKDSRAGLVKSAKSKTTRSPRVTSPEGNRTASLEWNPLRPINLSAGPNQRFGFNATPQYIVPNAWDVPMEVQPLAPTKEDALCYFMRSHSFPGAFWSSDMMGRFMMQSDGPISQCAMKASINAVASAMLCRVQKVTSLMEVARKEYVSALTLLNDALANPEEAKSNQALGAVVLLAIYEVVTSRAPQDIDLWTNHINGATALLEMRGPDQLKTETGLRLFMHLRYQIIISCMQRDTRVPESLLEGSKYILDLRPSEAYGNRLIIIVGRLSNLRADIIAHRITDDQQIIAGASAIEADLIAWLAGLPPGFSYEVHKKDRFDFQFQQQCRGLALYDEQYHVYPNLWVCNSWNQYRCARIIVSEMILTHVRNMSDSSSMRALSEEFRQQCQTLRATIHRLAVDICRSVPFCLGVHHNKSDPSLPPPDSYLGGLILLWPMYLAGTAEKPTHPLRRWVVQCLRMVGNTYGLDQALALMDIVAADPGILREEEQNRITEVPGLSTLSPSDMTNFSFQPPGLMQTF
ncbi:hypothetical protein N7520_004536 [Penicillium odoratum]|uniref:uncharacterized protein n=1 Tax=Penicillium odoratum TaxID=1167516 RepID=UPI002547B25C|nr:uncharacterized protein N7520_004536 [Penicillium odoratum]KAJ5764977.1 hypothetical protein N7520_004536 [Penicillium odoratum]